MPTIVCLSDTHSWHRDVVVPPGDVLIHAGDVTRKGELKTLIDFNDWLGTLPHRHKIVICGNHDFCFEEQPTTAQSLIRNAIYLQDEMIEIDGLRFYGSPWQPWFGGWAFNLQRGAELAAKWSMIPDKLDVLITHGPPAGILDRTFRGDNVGCQDLLERVRVIRPRLHVFGHIHEAAGMVEADGITFVNACVTSGRQSPVVLEW